MWNVTFTIQSCISWKTLHLHNLKQRVNIHIYSRWIWTFIVNYYCFELRSHNSLLMTTLMILLQPYVDTRSGDVDTWPAHASGQAGASTTLMLSKNKSLILYDEEAMGKPKMIPKPRFLEQLESYLKKELRALGVTDVNANELRLQVN